MLWVAPGAEQQHNKQAPAVANGVHPYNSSGLNII